MTEPTTTQLLAAADAGAASLVAGAIARSLDQAYAGYLAQLARASVPSGTDAGVVQEWQERRTAD